MAYKIVIADDEAITRLDLKERLICNGYEVVAEATDGFDAVEACKSVHPDIVILDIKMPLLDGISAARIIHDENLADCIIMLTAYSDRQYIRDLSEIGVMGYVMKPCQDNVLIPAIEIAMSRSKEIVELRNMLDQKDDKLKDRQVIDKAKGIIMSNNNLTEQEAYEYIRSVSMNKRKSMKSIAEAIIISNQYMK